MILLALKLHLLPLQRSAENKAAIADLTEKVVEVDKPAGKRAEKKMPKPEKQKDQRRRQCLAPKLYNNMMKENLKKETPRSEALAQSPLALARASLKTHLEKGRLRPLQRHDHPEDASLWNSLQC